MERFEKKVWLATPMMHGEELEYVKLGHKPLEMEDHFFMYYDILISHK